MATWPRELGHLHIPAEMESFRSQVLNEVAEGMRADFSPTLRDVHDAHRLRGTQTGRWSSGAATSGEGQDATARSVQLLLSYLTPAQRDEYQTSESFTIRGSRGGLWRIEAGRTTDLRNNTRYCLVFESRRGYRSPPDGDLLLARKLLIEADEDEFKRRANLLGRAGGPHHYMEGAEEVWRRHEYFTMSPPVGSLGSGSRAHVENVEMHMSYDRGMEMRVSVQVTVDQSTIEADIRSGTLARHLADQVQQHLMTILGRSRGR